VSSFGGIGGVDRMFHSGAGTGFIPSCSILSRESLMVFAALFGTPEHTASVFILGELVRLWVDEHEPSRVRWNQSGSPTDSFVAKSDLSFVVYFHTVISFMVIPFAFVHCELDPSRVLSLPPYTDSQIPVANVSWVAPIGGPKDPIQTIRLVILYASRLGGIE
jgi:hypothetical protein